MPRILSRTDLRRKKGRHHSFNNFSSFPSNSTATGGSNATWDQQSFNNTASSHSLNRLPQQTRIKGHIGHGNRSQDAYDRSSRKNEEQMNKFMSTSPATVSTSCENFSASESLNTAYSAEGQSSSKAGSFLPRMPSFHEDWGQYVDVSEASTTPGSHPSHMNQPQWKKFFH